jgi:DNA repair protein RecO (recombination protein O)
MTAPRTYQTEAIIIKHHKFGEADRVLTLYTPAQGKLRAIAKGTCRPGSKLGGHVELLTYSQLLLARGRNLDIITQAETLDSFMALKENLKLMSSGLYITELIDAFTVEEIADKDLFALVIATFQQLEQEKNIDSILRYFELHILDRSGYKPQLQRCSACNSLLPAATNCFSPAQGGVLCVDCGFEEPISYPISLNALKVLRLWQNCDYTTALKINIKDELALELEKILRDYIRHVLERQIKSTDFMDKLKY